MEAGSAYKHQVSWIWNEGEVVLLDGQVVDTLGFQRIRHRLGDKDGQHDRDNVSQSSCKFEHDNCKGYSCALINT